MSIRGARSIAVCALLLCLSACKKEENAEPAAQEKKPAAQATTPKPAETAAKPTEAQAPRAENPQGDGQAGSDGIGRRRGSPQGPVLARRCDQGTGEG